MFFSILYMMSELFSHGTMAPAVLILFLVVDVALLEVISTWIEH